MKKSFFCWLTFGLILFPTLVGAQADGQIYVIKKGDTLWGISQRFIKDPYYWPNLWSNNPDIANPHFIYPGQKVRIYDGRIEIVAATPEEMPPSPEPVPSAEPEEKIFIKTLGGSEGFIALDDINALGVLVDTVDNRIMMGEGDEVFFSMANLQATQAGDRFDLVEVGEDVTHPVTGEVLGKQIAALGRAEVTRVHTQVATARITDSYREILRGALALPSLPPVMEVELKQTDRDISGYIIAAKGRQIALGQHDLVYLDLGALDGLENGNLVYISRQRTATELGLEGEEVELPDVLLGSAVVLQAGARTSSALVLKSVAPIFRGDRVRTVTE